MKSIIIGLITGLVNGLFGSGGGTVLVPAMERFMKTPAHKAHATAIAVILPLSALSALLYINRLQVDVKSLVAVCLGGILGGFIGARLLSKISGRLLHIVFGLCMLAGAVRMVF